MRAASQFLLGLAPGGGYLAADIAANAGERLTRLFTLAPSPCSLRVGEVGVEGAVCFCGPIQQVASLRDFPGTVLYGVRTFLKGLGIVDFRL